MMITGNCGAVEESGTADRAYGIEGGQRQIKGRMSNMARLSRDLVEFAKKHGYVETIPDRDVCAERGYPIMCSRSEWGKIVETTPFSYHVQGTAMQWMAKAMVRCQDQLDGWRSPKFDGYIVLQVHDELVFDFPRAAHPLKDRKRSNLWRALILQKLMEQGGDDIGVPTPTSLEYIDADYSGGIAV